METNFRFLLGNEFLFPGNEFSFPPRKRIFVSRKQNFVSGVLYRLALSHYEIFPVPPGYWLASSLVQHASNFPADQEDTGFGGGRGEIIGGNQMCTTRNEK